MRIIILAAFTVIGLGFVGGSTASAVPANLNAISEAATGDALITQAYYYRRGYCHRRHCWWRYGYRHCRW